MTSNGLPACSPDPGESRDVVRSGHIPEARIVTRVVEGYRPSAVGGTFDSAISDNHPMLGARLVEDGRVTGDEDDGDSMMCGQRSSCMCGTWPASPHAGMRRDDKWAARGWCWPPVTVLTSRVRPDVCAHVVQVRGGGAHRGLLRAVRGLSGGCQLSAARGRGGWFWPQQPCRESGHQLPAAHRNAHTPLGCQCCSSDHLERLAGRRRVRIRLDTDHPHIQAHQPPGCVPQSPFGPGSKRPQPAPDGGWRPAELRGDRPLALAGGMGQQCLADHGGGIRTSGKHHPGDEHMGAATARTPAASGTDQTHPNMSA